MTTTQPDRSLAEKLDALFRAHGDASLEDVARAIRQSGGHTISASYLWLLRTGKKDNPILRHVEALARYFGVAPGHFFADGLAEAVTGDAEGLAALRSPVVRRLAVRAAGLSERSRQALADLAAGRERARRTETWGVGEGGGPPPSPTEEDEGAGRLGGLCRRPRKKGEVAQE